MEGLLEGTKTKEVWDFIMKADPFDAAYGSLWKFKKQNFHKPPTLSLEILKNRISTNALILRKESTAFTTPLPPSHYSSRRKKQNQEPYGNVEITKTVIPTFPQGLPGCDIFKKR
jgi:hypothetical protein